MRSKLHCSKARWPAGLGRTNGERPRRLRTTSLANDFALIGLIACMALAACTRSPSEDALRAQLQAAQGAIESRDANALVDVIADDFVGPDGLDRVGIRRMVTLRSMQHARVGMTVAGTDIKLQDDHASVSFRAALTGAESGSLPDSAQVYAVQTGWRFSDGKWRMTSATWEPGL